MTCFYIKKTVTYNGESDCPGTVLEYTYGVRENMVAQKLIKLTNPECDIIRRPDFDNTQIKFYADQYSFKSEKSAKMTLTKLLKKIRELGYDTCWTTFDCKYEVVPVEVV